MAAFVLVLTSAFCIVEGLQGRRAGLAGARGMAPAGPPLALPELPAELRALGVRLLSDNGLGEVLAETQCLTHGRLNFNLTITMCGHAGDSTFVGSWWEHGRADLYGLRRPGLDPEGVFVDAGTYIGDTTLMMTKLFPKAKIYGFEPMPRSYFYLRWNLWLNGVPEIPCQGPPDAGGVCAFSEPMGFGDGAPLKIRVIRDAAQEGGSAMTNRQLKKNDANVGTVFEDLVVSTMSPSQLFQKAAINKLEFLKLDCQGCEWAATKDMVQHDLLRRTHVVAAEVHCVRSELPELDRAELQERHRLYHLLKEKSGPWFSDACVEGSGNTYATFDIDKELLKNGVGRLSPAWVFALVLAVRVQPW